MIALGVRDLPRSVRFYRDGIKPAQEVAEKTAKQMEYPYNP
jgi:catechol 2,3-dioxygenase-like lactoylglutathione lyase family enzyme